MKGLVVLVVVAIALALSTLAPPRSAHAGQQCKLAAEFGFMSPSQNIMCAYEFLFELG